MKLKQVFFLGLAVTLMGCGVAAQDKIENPKSASTKQSALGKDAYEISSKDGSFTISVINDWIRSDDKEPRYAAALKKVGNSEAAQSIKSLTDNPMIQVMLFSEKGILAKDPFVENLNVVVLDVPEATGKEDMKEIATLASKQVFTGAAEDISTFDSPFGAVGTYRGQTTIGNSPNHDVVGAIVIHEKKSYTFTLSTKTGKGAGFVPVFQEVVRSMKFKS